MAERTVRNRPAEKTYQPAVQYLALCVASRYANSRTMYKEILDIGPEGELTSCQDASSKYDLVADLTKMLRIIQLQRDKQMEEVLRLGSDQADRIRFFISVNYACQDIGKRAEAYFHISVNRLSDILIKSGDVSFTRYVRRFRLREARHFVLNSDLMIKEIADLVGYGSETVLIRYYKQDFGVTPAQDRKKNRPGLTGK